MSTSSKATIDPGHVKKAPLPPKPPRPYNPYHIFFRLERSFILQTASDPQVPHAKEYDQGASKRPFKYRNILMPKDWYVSKAVKRKRRDHKIHGVISFKDLSKSMSQRWDTADSETKEFCTALAKEQKDRYNEELNQYVQRYGEYALKEQRKKNRQGVRKERINTKVVKSIKKSPTTAKPQGSLKKNHPIAVSATSPMIQSKSIVQRNLMYALSEHGGQDEQEGTRAQFGFNLDVEGYKNDSQILSLELEYDGDCPDADTIGTIDVETIASVDNLDTEFDFVTPALCTFNLAGQESMSPPAQVHEIMHKSHTTNITHGGKDQSFETLNKQPFGMKMRSINISRLATNNIGGNNTYISVTSPNLLLSTPLTNSSFDHSVTNSS